MPSRCLRDSRVYNRGVIESSKPPSESRRPVPRERFLYREGVLIFAAMILSGIVTVGASVYIVRNTDLIQMSVREPKADRVEQLRKNRTPPKPVPYLKSDGTNPSEPSSEPASDE